MSYACDLFLFGSLNMQNPTGQHTYLGPVTLQKVDVKNTLECFCDPVNVMLILYYVLNHCIVNTVIATRHLICLEEVVPMDLVCFCHCNFVCVALNHMP